MSIRPRDPHIDTSNPSLNTFSTMKNTRANIRKSTSEGSIVSGLNAEKQQKTLQTSDGVAQSVLSGKPPQDVMTIGRHRGIKVEDGNSGPKGAMTVGRNQGKATAEKSPSLYVLPITVLDSKVKAKVLICPFPLKLPKRIRQKPALNQKCQTLALLHQN